MLYNNLGVPVSRKYGDRDPSSYFLKNRDPEEGGAYCDVAEVSELVTLSNDALDTDNESVDPSFDLDSSLKSDNDFLVEQFCEDWVLQLDRDDKVSLGVFLCFQLSKHVGLGETKAAELAGAMIGISDRVVREWRSAFFRNDGCIPESEQGP